MVIQTARETAHFSPSGMGRGQSKGILKSRTTARSFRVNESALKIIEAEAARQGVSINTLVNQLFVEYAEIGRFTKSFRVLRVSQATFGQIMGLTKDEELAGVARKLGATGPPAFITSKWGRLSVATALEFVRDLSAANWFEYYETTDEGKRTLTLMHEMGSKWSVFLSHYLGELFRLAGMLQTVSVTDRAVTFVF